MRIHVPDEELELLLAQWELVAAGEPPVYRFAKCWRCGRYLFFGMYHVFFRHRQREAHLCGRCGKLYEVRG